MVTNGLVYNCSLAKDYLLKKSDFGKQYISSSLQGLFRKVVLNLYLIYRYVDIVAGMTVTDDGDIVIVDSVQPSLYKLDEHGSLSTWFDCKGVMTEPSDIAVRGDHDFSYIYLIRCKIIFT